MAGVRHTGGKEDPIILQRLIAMKSDTGAQTFVDDFRKAVKACDMVSMKLVGAPKSDMYVSEISFRDFGDDRFAARFTPTSPELYGLELEFVVAKTDEIVTQMTFLTLDSSIADHTTEVALTKVYLLLGTSTNPVSPGSR